MGLNYLWIIIFLISCNKDITQSLESSDTKLVNDLGGSNDLVRNTNETNFTEEFMSLVNDHRKNLGLKALILNEDLSSLATEHSLDMAKDLVPFGHLGFSERCKNAYVYLGGGNLCAENVAMGQKSAQDVFSAWMNSSGHRANIESSRLTHTGFGYGTSDLRWLYWTQIFIEFNN